MTASAMLATGSGIPTSRTWLPRFFVFLTTIDGDSTLAATASKIEAVELELPPSAINGGGFGGANLHHFSGGCHSPERI
jgi:hypothetical protein